jgi:hypothetical protein
MLETAMRKLSWVLVLGGLLSACGTGFDIVGVRAATATRDADDHVTVTAILTCMDADTAEQGACEDDGKEFCVNAEWVDRYPEPTERGPYETVCQTLPTVAGSVVVIRSKEPIPRDLVLRGFLSKIIVSMPADLGPEVIMDSP